MNRRPLSLLLLLMMFTTSALRPISVCAEEIDLSAFVSSENEYPITFDIEKSVDTRYGKISIKGENTLTATVTVDQEATLYYFGGGEASSSMEIKVYVDDELTHTYNPKAVSHFSYSSSFTYGRMFEKIPQGTHVIKWVLTGDGTWHYSDITVRATPLITVNLLEPGSLGTEVLYNVNDIRDVRCLKVVGKMNADDFTKLKMMYNLYELDLSEAFFTEIPDRQFYAYTKTDMGCLHNSTLKSIGYFAFYNCDGLTNVEIPQSVTSVDDGIFYRCRNLKSVSLPVGIYSLKDGYRLFQQCWSLTDITLYSPTVIDFYDPWNKKVEYGSIVEDYRRSDITIHVPDFIANLYKLNSYWYNFKSIEGFSTAEIQDWTLENALILNHDRLEGVPNMFIGSGGNLKINGDLPMSFNDLTFWSDRNGYYGRLISNCSNVDIKGALTIHYYTHTAKEWRFVSLPFDMKVGDITSNNPDAKYAIRYYDGANRAVYGPSGSWKNYDDEDIIPAGTGFIFCSNLGQTTWYFHALDNESKQQCVSNREFVTTLAVNDSENASNKGWNLVGNPWQCYYNDHALNFTGPITVWNVGNRTYTAYSITDDDYAICPNEAFFVQCPNEEFNTIGFPTNGRQLTAVIEKQNASNARVAVAAQRQLVDVIISNGEDKDQTRVVLNEQASMDYELSCDAAKMMSMDASVPQLFTTDVNGTQYAINERPVGTGIIPLGFFVPADGTYTISLGRNNAEEVILVDYESGTEQSIVDVEYRFMACAGMNEGRFALKFTAGAATGISITEDADKTPSTMYNLAGQRIFNEVHGVSIVNGKKVVNQ